MEPPVATQPDKDKISIVLQQPLINQALVHLNTTLVGVSIASQQTNLEKLSRPMAFDKMEGYVREMQDPESGVPVRQQKIFLTSIPYAFMGYDLIEWLMDRLSIEESEALNIANQLCLHGYFFPVNDTKTLVVKDDSSLYRFQTPYYWPWQHKTPDNVEYAIYLAKRSLRNKQRHGLEDYENDTLSSLHKNLKGKWDFISMQAEEQVRLAKERKKGDKIVSDSQERAYWRVHRPPPGQFTPLEPCPVPSRDRQGIKPKKKTIEDWQREVDYLNKSLIRTRMKMSQACECLVNYWEIFSDYDYFIQPVLPSNPWVSEDITFWQLNGLIVEIPTEKRVKRWSISIEELVSDATGLQEFTNFLEKEYSHENIRFWIAVNKLRRSAHSQVPKKVNEIYEEFLKPGAPCEINIDGKTMEIVQKELKSPSRFSFDAAAEHIYTLLLKKDCYPRFVRSEHYKSLLASGIQPSHKKRFFNFGGVAKKKSSAVQQSNQGLMVQTTAGSTPPAGNLSKRRGSDRSLSGSANELALIVSKDCINKVIHSHSQSNLSEIPFREVSKQLSEALEPSLESSDVVCPWECKVTEEISSIYPREESCSDVIILERPINTSKQSVGSNKITKHSQKSLSNTSEVTEITDRLKRSCGLRQNTVDCDFNAKRLIPAYNEHRRSSMINTTRVTDFQNELTIDRTVNSSMKTFITASNSKIYEFSNPKLNPPITSDLTETKNLSKNEYGISVLLESKNQNLEKELDEQTIENNKILSTKDSKSKKNSSFPINENNLLHQKIIDEKIKVMDKSENFLECLANEFQSTTQEPKEVYKCIFSEEELTPVGYIAPAPTPTPLLAPLAEIEIDGVDDEAYTQVEPKLEKEETKKKKKKPNLDAKKLDENPESNPKVEEKNGNAVCPWEDENVTTGDGTFTKTYATLGYL